VLAVDVEIVPRAGRYRVSGVAPGPWLIAEHGDYREQRCWPLFGAQQFPSYETYWRGYVVPLTRRDWTPPDIHFKSDSELAQLDPPRTKHDLDLARLHYATFWHMCAAYELRNAGPLDLDSFTGCITRLASATDTADAFLTLVDGPGLKPKEARERWRAVHRDTKTWELRMYRNHLVHGAPFMQRETRSGLCFPRIGREQSYHDDWRGPIVREDFASPESIIDAAWGACLNYFERQWVAMLSRVGPPSKYPLASPLWDETTYASSATVQTTVARLSDPPPDFWTAPEESTDATE
jgi:hypothetical protein